MFTRDFLGLDQPVLPVDTENLTRHSDELIDFRPYINENVITVSSNDSLLKCAELFRKMHLRHLCVTHPLTGKLSGIITR